MSSTKGARAPPSLPVKKQSYVGVASSSRSKEAKLQAERDEAVREAKEGRATIALLSRKVAELTTQIRQLNARFAEREDSNEQAKHQFQQCGGLRRIQPRRRRVCFS